MIGKLLKKVNWLTCLRKGTLADRGFNTWDMLKKKVHLNIPPFSEKRKISFYNKSINK